MHSRLPYTSVVLHIPVLLYTSILTVAVRKGGGLQVEQHGKAAPRLPLLPAALGQGPGHLCRYSVVPTHSSPYYYSVVMAD